MSLREKLKQLLLKHVHFYRESGVSCSGSVKLRDAHTGEILEENHNIEVDDGLKLICYMLTDESGYDTGLTYQAIGTDSTTPTVSDTTLGTETNRKTFTERKTNFTTDIRMEFSTFFTASEADDVIGEVGIFGHDATGALDSGTLFCRALLSFDNSAATNDITITWAVIVSRT